MMFGCRPAIVAWDGRDEDSCLTEHFEEVKAGYRCSRVTQAYGRARTAGWSAAAAARSAIYGGQARSEVGSRPGPPCGFPTAFIWAQDRCHGHKQLCVRGAAAGRAACHESVRALLFPCGRVFLLEPLHQPLRHQLVTSGIGVVHLRHQIPQACSPLNALLEERKAIHQANLVERR